MKKYMFILILITISNYVSFGCDHFTVAILNNQTYQRCDCPVYWNEETVKQKYDISLGKDDFVAFFTETPPVIDGIGNDKAWERARWQPICYEWMYQSANMSRVSSTDDFSGRFKVVWTDDRLFVLVEIIDDIKSTVRLGSPYNSPQNDDCLEIFINENGQGGARRNTASFFAYHMSFDGNVADYIGPPNLLNSDPNRRIENGYILRNHHLNYKIENPSPNKYVWEIEMKIYDSTYPLRSSPELPPIVLTEGKRMGFAIAYCDSDGLPSGNPVRNHFIGSMSVTGSTDERRNQSYLNSSQYAKLYLVK